MKNKMANFVGDGEALSSFLTHGSLCKSHFFLRKGRIVWCDFGRDIEQEGL